MGSWNFTEFIERTLLDVDFSMLNLTNNSISDLNDILKDEIISEDEHHRFFAIMENRIRDPTSLSFMMRDGWINSEELKNIDLELLGESGIKAHDERSYHIKAWLPKMAPIVDMSYFYFVDDEILNGV